MPVFRNRERRIYAILSYKVLYSKLSGAKKWQEMGIAPTPKIFLRAVLKDRPQATFFLVRSPYARTVSCFMDKFRKQPRRIQESGFRWQHCHELLYPHLGISRENSDHEIAEKFLAMSFDQFLEILPLVHRRDGHYHPQWWSTRVVFSGKTMFSWPGVTVLRVEEGESLGRLPDIDFSVRANFTDHLDRDFEVSEKHREIIRKLYSRDFAMGNYPT